MHEQEFSPRILLYTTEPPDQEDQLVILCSWADAQRKHIIKYTQLHRAVTLRASILLIRTSSAVLFQPYTWQRAALKPAAQYIVENALADRQMISSSDDGGQTEQGQGRNKKRYCSIYVLMVAVRLPPNSSSSSAEWYMRLSL